MKHAVLVGFLSLTRAFIIPYFYQRRHFQCSPFILQASTGSNGKVENVEEWLQWTSDSLSSSHGISLFEAIGVDSWEAINGDERYAVLSHGIQEDPIFCYSNRAAQKTFGYTENELYALPSRYSAPASERNRRKTVMDKKDDGNFWLIERGVRQRKDGSLFEFRDVWLWNVYDSNGERVGQSAVYDRDKIVDLE